ncbi:hypothetical protein HYH03_000130 [Edaphochlamys debaryana]|uniref:Uncharacterized protein n=1 Tax=Edaphochlamys debaryana TaxID=47281 RepID=A0A836C678_9CHLO|nr:hypothetical protein HYH03_000130 [Edaphochlamys debaryana]|eukprot:KAG2501625.1 hypothetical protein HYH03_000130 [Edaphochlamys debaryana]
MATLAPEEQAVAAESVQLDETCNVEVLDVQETAPEGPVGPRDARKAGANVPLAAVATAAAIALGGGILALLRKGRGKKLAPQRPTEANTPEPTCEPTPTEVPVVAQVKHASHPAIPDLSPFGSPVGGTPLRIGKEKASRQPPSEPDTDDQSDNASVKDQRHSLLDAAQLHRTLKQMQELAEENRKLSQFLTEYKADADKLSKLEEENRALRDVTRNLEQELQEIKSATLPRTGAELEMFKQGIRVPSTARSVCSNDETVIGVGISTASLDEVKPAERLQRVSVFKQLLQTLGAPSGNSSAATTPRASGGGALTPRGSTGGAGSRQRTKPAPEEAAAIGQAVYQLLDQFGGRLM